MRKILLVAPVPLRFELTQDESYMKLPFLKAKGFLLPLGIATVAGLTPDHYHVDLWDEGVQGPIDEKPDLDQYDLVGITGYTAHLPRGREISAMFRKKGIMTVSGGPGISSLPHRHMDDFDAIFIGEAELTWPQFLSEWEKGTHRKVYRQVAPIDLSLARMPKWNGIQIRDYRVGAVQTSRGCPYACEFCDVSYILGKAFRHKPVDQVIAEVKEMYELGMRGVVMCDDIFNGNPKYTKELLRKLIPLNNSFKRPLGFATEATINMAGDDELLQLMADANFMEVFIGIESPDEDSLRETGKFQNARRDLIADLHRIQNFGIPVRGSLIVGFDNDTTKIFDRQFEFAQEASITVPSVRVLMAPPGTRLWDRVRREGRLLKTDSQGRFFGNPGTSNIVPKGMTRQELHRGYLDLLDKMYDWDNFAVRIKGYVDLVERKPEVPRTRPDYGRTIRFTLFMHFVLDKEVRTIVKDILRHTRNKASWLLPRVRIIILRQFGYWNRPALRDSVLRQIEVENAPGFDLEMSSDEALIPEGFKKPYEQVFPEVYSQAFEATHSAARTEGVVTEVFARFLQAHGNNGLDSLSDAHKEELEALTRQVLDESQDKEVGTRILPQFTATDEVAPNLRRMHLAREVLIAVEQELMVKATTSAAL